MHSVTAYLPLSASLSAGFLFLINVSMNEWALGYSLVVETCCFVKCP
jgi:hypothetical protein